VMALGFVRSIFTNHSAQDSSWYGEITAARLYGVAYFIGAVVSLQNPIYAVAQIFWGLGYLHFPKDT
jgi:hypothetical protein